VTYLWFTPTRLGSFDVLCQELCGIAHFAMRGRMVVREPEDFEQWLARHPTFAETSRRPPADPVAGRDRYATCAACHGAQGEGNAALNAPKLTGLGGWYLRRQLVHYKEGVRGTHEKDTYGRMMAPMVAALDAAAIEDVVAYITTLPDRPASATVEGDVRRGQRRYATCAACHGPDGRGIAATNAPKLAGMSDWYLLTQLKNFRDGVRGGHPQDVHGSQMRLLGAMLRDDQAIRDVVAYINTL
jgi:cytochrome c oxidase subunit II